ncbi:ABC transporter ATP-binding protein [Limobrevibacterium gyesilva]|uniref:ABC transporter ATP-binding protein n=1 Tax=Limobrevibacterium gyesilva TaxID=2991712 RepID=A0AA41YNJ0_9PROT|nr:ABC transporter ATP-binding protein [Limobrevibacterium gyesilva]MCW3473590.1 ABC transporter ATP-binding protein [Limobrevibacterium gyesilva]
MPPVEEILTVHDLRCWYPVRAGLFGGIHQYVKAVDGVSFAVRKGEVLGLVGESGSGKTTIGRTVLRLNAPTGGSIVFRGQDITHLTRRRMRPIRQAMQLIFQDPFASLNPRMTVERILLTPLAIHDRTMPPAERHRQVEAALQMVGLSSAHASRYPHEFSGGQRQRIGIARALILRPAFLVADEPVSALDVSIQAQIVNLLLDLKEQLGLTILFIAHDLAVVGHISDRIAVMYLGRLMEFADTDALFANPQHPYTEALFSAAPDPDPTVRRQRIILQGDIPSPVAPPSGCVFRTRCRYALPACAEQQPAFREIRPGHFKACIRDDLALQGAGGQARERVPSS